MPLFLFPMCLCGSETYPQLTLQIEARPGLAWQSAPSIQPHWRHRYKVLLRWFCVPTRIAKSNPSYSERCLWGCGQRGDRIHIWWSCPCLVGFWSRVFDLLFTLFHVTIHKDAKLAVLHCPISGLFSYQHNLATLPIYCS